MSEQHTTSTLPAGIPQWTIADRFRKSREHAGLDQIEIAKEIGISRASVSNYERGHTVPTRPTMVAWAMRCGVPVEWLRDGREPGDGPDTPSGQVPTESTCMPSTASVTYLRAA